MKSQLTFKNFVIPKVSFEKLDVEGKKNEFTILPQAIINRSESQFHINVDVEINDVDNQFSLKILAVGIFEYDKINVDETTLLNFMSINGPAIIFPYIRSFVSSFTALSGFDTVTLPTLNLSGYKEELIKNLIDLDQLKDGE